MGKDDVKKDIVCNKCKTNWILNSDGSSCAELEVCPKEKEFDNCFKCIQVD
jgi:hypothetical protein